MQNRAEKSKNKYVAGLKAKFAISLVSFALCFLGQEIAVRVIGNFDKDGQFYFLNRRILPWKIQAHKYEEDLRAYLAKSRVSSFAYDENSGWIINPELEDVNSLGMHTDREYSKTVTPGTIRIALFGDSFTAGDEVKSNETWAYLLEQNLRQQGYNVEILNFGVSAYGMDQAYLRWLNVGKYYQPDIVVFGFQPGNMERNLTAFRPLIGGSFPLSKPRFILENGDLKLINSPPIPPSEKLIEVYKDFKANPFIKYEVLYDERYQENWWESSKLLSVIVYLSWPGRTEGEEDLYQNGAYVTDLAAAIINRFGTEVKQQGSEFVVVHLPPRGDLERAVNGLALPYDFVLNDIAKNYVLIRPEKVFTDKGNQYWMPGTHYSPQANQIVAKYVAKQILPVLKQRAISHN